MRFKKAELKFMTIFVVLFNKLFQILKLEGLKKSDLFFLRLLYDI